MLDTVGDYAGELLASRYDAADVAARHAAYYLELAERCHRELDHDQSSALALLEAEHDNLRAALEWGMRQPTPYAARLGAALYPFWYMRGYHEEGRRQLHRILDRWREPDTDRASILQAAAVIALRQGELHEANGLAGENVDLSRRLGSPEQLAKALNVAGNVARDAGDYQCANVRYRESLRLFRQLGDTRGVSVSLNNLGTSARHQGKYALATALHTESLALRRQVEDVFGVGYGLEQLAHDALGAGDVASAAAYGEESLALRLQLGDRHGHGCALILLATVARAEDSPVRAADHARQALVIGGDVGDSWLTATALAILAGTSRDTADWTGAARLIGAVSRLLQPGRLALLPADAARFAADTAAVRATLDETAFTCQYTIGRGCSPTLWRA